MTVIDDIDAIAARGDLTPNEKRTQIAVRRANEGRTALLSVSLPRTFNFAPYVITVMQASSNGGALFLTISATRSGVPISINNPVILYPPPLLVPDAVGAVLRGNNKRYRLDPIIAIRDTILDHLRRVAP